MKKSIVMLLGVVALALTTCQKEDSMVLNEIEPTLMKSLALPDDMLENIAYGPEQFIRTTGQPNVYEVSLSSIDFECVLPPYVLTVINGEDDGSFKITSGSVYLEGELIFSPSNFKKKVYQLEYEVEITESSTLNIELASKPGSYIHIYITGEYNEECNQDGLILWNKLGSEYEVLNSEYGPDLAFYTGGGGIDYPANREFVPGKFGNAITIGPGDYSLFVRYHNLVLNDLPEYLNPDRGTIECYIQLNAIPRIYSHMPYRIFDGAYGLNSGMHLQVGDRYEDGKEAILQWGFEFGGPEVIEITYPNMGDFLGEWVHVAAVWDRNGIDGSSETMQLYVDGDLVASTTKSNWGSVVGDRADIAGGNDQNIAEKFYLDNLKLWNYAKSTFDLENE